MDIDPGTSSQQSNEGQLHPIVEGVVSHTSGPSSTHGVVMPDDVVSGELLVIALTLDTFDFFDAPAGWTEGYESGNGSMRAALFGKIAAGTEGGTTVTITSDPSRMMAAQAFRISTWSGSLANIDIERDESVFSSETLDTSWGSYAVLWLNVFHSSMTGTFVSHPAGYSDLLETTTGNGTSHAQVYSCRLLNTASSDAGGTWSFSGVSGDYSCGSIAIKGTEVV